MESDKKIRNEMSRRAVISVGALALFSFLFRPKFLTRALVVSGLALWTFSPGDNKAIKGKLGYWWTLFTANSDKESESESDEIILIPSRKQTEN